MHKRCVRARHAYLKPRDIWGMLSAITVLLDLGYRMNKRLVSILCLLISGAVYGLDDYKPVNPMLFSGIIHFPDSVKMVPEVCVYCGGNKISTERDHKGKKLSLPHHRYQTQFYLLITEDFQFKCAFDNTINYLKIDTEQPYTFYVLTLKEKTSLSFAAKERSPEYYWDIKKMPLPYHNGRIPDTTIIICYNPAFIDTLKGGNMVELPTIRIKPNILNLVGSESKLHEKSIELLLASLDYDSIHARSTSQVKFDYQAKTVLAITT